MVANPAEDMVRWWLEVPEVVIAEGGAVSGFMPLTDMSGIEETAAADGKGPELGPLREYTEIAGLGDSISCLFPIAPA
jgi:hypothetical protein